MEPTKEIETIDNKEKEPLKEVIKEIRSSNIQLKDNKPSRKEYMRKYRQKKQKEVQQQEKRVENILLDVIDTLIYIVNANLDAIPQYAIAEINYLRSRRDIDLEELTQATNTIIKQYLINNNVSSQEYNYRSQIQEAQQKYTMPNPPQLIDNKTKRIPRWQLRVAAQQNN